MDSNKFEPSFSLTKSLLWIVGSLSLAILGSALWDFAFKPLVLWIGEQLALLTNLGSKALSEAMYREIAKGNYERVSLLLFQGLIGGVAGLALGLMMRKRSSLTEVQKRTSKSIRYAVALTVLGVLFLQGVRTSYIVRAANYLEQMQTIAAPVLPVEQRVQLRSRMAQIQSKEDYELLANDLIATIHEQKAVLPSFDAFK
ncbi:hypothetical protein EDE08_103335 [Bradyrhizobium sp. R2.2-H]|jgi:hypothetical protein|uniref:hypothetical protein n=1 Tax=unclassified Bradyrhizobium TaxID=2631580 RepID=UPI001050241F|nr:MULTISPECIES: hypothetical protein [unclassified Bradyrhizobium]TCU75118.1 hypothetical protein EDE10_103334 [Bradyrhizobium sp. Y-H1]TCU77886.1 hypothetical protein EDE08_103335 [Bradyrhizobium sp. R2.2-H]